MVNDKTEVWDADCLGIKITGDRQTGVLLSLSLFDLNKFKVTAHLTPVKHPL